jgi:hypothetical protein
MKTIRQIILPLILALSLPAFGATDMYLKIEGPNDYHKIIPLLCKDGACKRSMTKIQNFRAGTYTFTITDETGKALQLEDKPMRRSATVNLSVQTASDEYADAVISAAMGTPVSEAICEDSTCSPEVYVEKHLQAGNTFTETIEIIKDGVLLVDFGGIWSNGGFMFTDDWRP